MLHMVDYLDMVSLEGLAMDITDLLFLNLIKLLLNDGGQDTVVDGVDGVLVILGTLDGDLADGDMDGVIQVFMVLKMVLVLLAMVTIDLKFHNLTTLPNQKEEIL